MTGSAGTAMAVVLGGRSQKAFYKGGSLREGGQNILPDRRAGGFPNPWEIKGTDQFTNQGYRSGNPGKPRVQINS